MRPKTVFLFFCISLLFCAACNTGQTQDIYESVGFFTVQSGGAISLGANEENKRKLTAKDVEGKVAVASVVLTGASLENTITKFDLFSEERKRGASIGEISEQIRKSLKIQLESKQNDEKPKFRLSYQGSDAQETRKIAAVLMSRFVEVYGEYVSDSELITITDPPNLPLSPKQISLGKRVKRILGK